MNDKNNKTYEQTHNILLNLHKTTPKKRTITNIKQTKSAFQFHRNQTNTQTSTPTIHDQT